MVPGEGAGCDLGLGHAVGAHLVGSATERQRLGLGEEVGHEDVLVDIDLVRRVHHADEVGGDELRALMDELVVGVLAVGTGLTPDDLAGLRRDRTALAIDRLAVALHRELLEVRSEVGEVVAVGKHREGLGAEEVVVPDPDHTEEHGEIALERRGAEVLVDDAEALEHLDEVVGSDREHQREPDGGVVAVATADPVPEAEHVVGVDAEGGDRIGIGRHGDEVLGDRLLVTECRE